MKLAAMAAGICFLASAFTVGAQDNRSLTNSGLRTPQVISGSSTANEAPGDGPLYERLLLADNSIRALTESLAMANAEAETYKRQAADLSLKLQALGVDGAAGDESKLEQRLLAAVRDLRLSKKENEDLRSQLIQLSEAVLALMKTTETLAPESRLALETELRRAGELLGSAPGAAQAEAVEPALSDGLIVDVRDDLGPLVVANLGDKQGVKIGMPFQVWRNGERIGNIRVVDVRDRISGAVVQNLESEKNPVKAGDSLRVDARQ